METLQIVYFVFMNEKKKSKLRNLQFSKCIKVTNLSSECKFRSSMFMSDLPNTDLYFKCSELLPEIGINKLLNNLNKCVTICNNEC